MDTTHRRIGLGLALLAITGAILAIEAPWRTGSQVPEEPQDLPERLEDEPSAPDFGGAQAWINTNESIELTEQRGKVVLVDFWTYSCINCINTFPHLRAWHDAYADDGLVIVGVHTPEFRFERDVDNVRDATERHNLTYPVAIDNGYEIWDAYNNRYWPAKYLIDEYGKIRYTHFGEGAYDETEDRIRDLLTEAGREPDNEPTYVNSTRGGVRSGQTPELFASHLDGSKEHAIGNEEGYEPGETITYAPVEDVQANRIFLEGTWENTDEYVQAVEPNATVKVDFQAGGANFVASDLDGACARVFLDGDPLAERLAGPDVRYDDEEPCIPLDDDRAYDFYSGPFERHQVTLDVPEGFQLYSFAFSEEGRQR
jgi:thiol-disulfide isomerase/thioredoxin